VVISITQKFSVTAINTYNNITGKIPSKSSHGLLEKNSLDATHARQQKVYCNQVKYKLVQKHQKRGEGTNNLLVEGIP